MDDEIQSQPLTVVKTLSPQQRRVMELVAKGLGLRDVAAELNISINTVRTYMHIIYIKLGVTRATAAVAVYAKYLREHENDSLE